MQEKRLVLFSDYACPYSFFAEAGTARLREEATVQVEGAAFELRPAGTPLPAVETQWPDDTWTRTIEPLADEVGVVVKRPTLVVRTRKAHEAAAYARSEGRYPAMHAALYAAYWQEGRDIGRIDVLSEIGSEVGLDASGLRVALDIDQQTARVEQDEAWAARLGLDAVPAWIMMHDGADGTGVAAGILVGLQRYEELKAWVERDNDI
ncbi:MAG TPA: DsbA family protein [Longimicrobiales bacterium]|nr:DsbA family protein [Longimicrobiales bacterium]